MVSGSALGSNILISTPFLDLPKIFPLKMTGGGMWSGIPHIYSLASQTPMQSGPVDGW
jgi:hypothetical protein